MVSKKLLYTELLSIFTNQRQLTGKGTRIVKELTGTNPTTPASATGDNSTNNNSTNNNSNDAISRKYGKKNTKSHKLAKTKAMTQKATANHLFKELGMKSAVPRNTKRNYSSNSLHTQKRSHSTNQLSPKNNPYLNGGRQIA